MPGINVQYADVGNTMLKAEQIKGAGAVNTLRQQAIEAAPQKKKADLLQYETDILDWSQKVVDRMVDPSQWQSFVDKAVNGFGVNPEIFAGVKAPTTMAELTEIKRQVGGYTKRMRARVKTTIYDSEGNSTEVLLGPNDKAPEGWSTIKKAETPLAKKTRLRKEGREDVADVRAGDTAARADREEKARIKKLAGATGRTTRLDKEKAVKRISDLEKQFIMIKSKGVTPDMVSGVSAEAAAILQSFMGKKLGEADLASIRNIFDQEIAGLRSTYGIVAGPGDGASAPGGGAVVIPGEGTVGTYEGKPVVVRNGAWTYAD